jgi:hypothetical protein
MKNCKNCTHYVINCKACLRPESEHDKKPVHKEPEQRCKHYEQGLDANDFATITQGIEWEFHGKLDVQTIGLGYGVSFTQGHKRYGMVIPMHDNCLIVKHIGCNAILRKYKNFRCGNNAEIIDADTNQVLYRFIYTGKPIE